jgi:hypothetical protein
MKKKRFEHTERAKKRRDKHKKTTKATLKRDLLAHFKEALTHIETYNRAPSLDAKILHIGKALAALDRCLEIRPGNHVLRTQRTLCQEELWEIETMQKVGPERRIEIILDPDWQP